MAAFTVEGLIRSASLFSFPQFATTHLYSTCGVRCRVYLCVLGVGGGMEGRGGLKRKTPVKLTFSICFFGSRCHDTRPPFFNYFYVASFGSHISLRLSLALSPRPVTAPSFPIICKSEWADYADGHSAGILSRKLAHTPLVRERSSTIISAC